MKASYTAFISDSLGNLKRSQTTDKLFTVVKTIVNEVKNKSIRWKMLRLILCDWLFHRQPTMYIVVFLWLFCDTQFLKWSVSIVTLVPKFHVHFMMGFPTGKENSNFCFSEMLLSTLVSGFKRCLQSVRSVFITYSWITWNNSGFHQMCRDFFFQYRSAHQVAGHLIFFKPFIIVCISV